LEADRFVTAVDIGCGGGRNSLFLASNGLDVVALDYAPSPIRSLLQKADQLKLNNKIRAIVHDVTMRWPIADGMIDIGVDTYCFKHQIHDEAVNCYIKELSRVMRPGADFLLFLADKTDGYYSQFRTEWQSGVGTVIRDPGNKILSRLYEREEIEGLFEKFSVVNYMIKKSRNEMHGKAYDRLSHVWHMRHQP
jgi:SAM-dependent methyltransferase